MKELRKVVLPLCEPLLSTYHYEGSVCSILHDNPTIENWYLNNVVGLRCNRAFIGSYTTPEVSVWNSSFFENPYIERIPFPLKYLGVHLHDVIRSLIDEGYYVFISALDDFYIEGKSWYQERHFNHDCLIFGYDQTDQTYHMLAYDQKWRYQPFKTSKKGVEAARKSSFRTQYFGNLYALKPFSERVELDEKQVLRELETYLDSTWEKYPPSENEFAYGAIVHDYMTVYLYKQFLGAFPYERIDRRIFRALWEQKRLMLKRIEAFEEKLNLGTSLSESYAPCVKEADAMRMLYASHVLKRRDSVLPTLQKRVLLLKEAERIVLEQFIKELKEKINREDLAKDSN